MDDEPNEFEGYDAGWRRGIFDKCNGREAFDFSKTLDTPFNRGYIDGYVEAYVSNEVRIAA